MRGTAMPVPAGSLRLLARTWCCLMMLLVLHCDTAGAQCTPTTKCSTKYELMIRVEKKACAAEINVDNLPIIKMVGDTATTTMAMKTTTEGGRIDPGTAGPRTVTTKKPEMTDAPALATRTVALSKTAMATALMVAGSLTGTRGPALILTGLGLAYTVSCDDTTTAPTATHLVVMYAECVDDDKPENVKYNYVSEGTFSADKVFIPGAVTKLPYMKPDAAGMKLIIDIYEIPSGTTVMYASNLTANTAIAKFTFNVGIPETLNFMTPAAAGGK